MGDDQDAGPQLPGEDLDGGEEGGDVSTVLDGPGQKVEAFALGGRIEFVPVRPIEEMRGFLRGMDPDFEREPDREL